MPVVRPVRPAWQPSPGRRGLSRLVEQLAELGVEVDAQLFELSLTHRSYAYEAGKIPSNERLEFLGDAVLQIVVTDHIFRTYPDLAEGELAKLRASVVSAVALADVARQLEVGPLIKLGKGEIATKGHEKRSILADTLEAVIGCVYLSAGMGGAEALISHLFQPLVSAAAERGDYADFKTILQERCAAAGWEAARYEHTVAGPDHDRLFTAEVVVDGRVLGTGVGPSKRRAEQIAARMAVDELGDA
ncbi:MAG: ribonuclease III [Propionibacterium sp.]|nr:ribonuclease III [Propionibacterium sp.]